MESQLWIGGGWSGQGNRDLVFCFCISDPALWIYTTKLRKLKYDCVKIKRQLCHSLKIDKRRVLIWFGDGNFFLELLMLWYCCWNFVKFGYWGWVTYALISSIMHIALCMPFICCISDLSFSLLVCSSASMMQLHLSMSCWKDHCLDKVTPNIANLKTKPNTIEYLLNKSLTGCQSPYDIWLWCDGHNSSEGIQEKKKKFCQPQHLTLKHLVEL